MLSMKRKMRKFCRYACALIIAVVLFSMFNLPAKADEQIAIVHEESNLCVAIDERPLAADSILRFTGLYQYPLYLTDLSNCSRFFLGTVPYDPNVFKVWEAKPNETKLTPSIPAEYLTKRELNLGISTRRCVSITRNGPYGTLRNDASIYVVEPNSQECHDDFVLQTDGSLHIADTKYCVHPSGGTGNIGARLVAFNICGEDRLKFKFVDPSSL